jgi:tRNA(fMet)-specific endonuclease VapC
MRYLLDTNACIGLINENPALIRTRLDQARRKGAEIFVSAVAAFELWYGVMKSPRREFNAKRLETFFSGPIALLPFEVADAEVAGQIRASLEITGRLIGAYDVLIAGQAIRHQLTLVTANVREFSRVAGLSWQDWSKS